MGTARLDATATLLTDGKVLIAGGANENEFNPLSSIELCDPTQDKWSYVSSMAAKRRGPTATLLKDGKVLVVGGFGSQDTLSSAELYDVEADQWLSAGAMATSRQMATATLLKDGRVFVAGGNAGAALSSAEIYEPASYTDGGTADAGQ